MEEDTKKLMLAYNVTIMESLFGNMPSDNGKRAFEPQPRSLKSQYSKFIERILIPSKVDDLDG